MQTSTLTAKELRAARVAKNMTQQEFANWLGGVSRPSVTGWEQGAHPVPQWVAEKLQASRSGLNPQLTYDAWMKAGEKATAKGQTLEQWVADLIKGAIGLALLYAGFQLFV